MKWLSRILSLFTNYNHPDSLLTDYEESYQEYKINYGRLRSRLWLGGQILLVVIQSIRNSIYWSLVMLTNYFKIAFRVIKRNTGYSLINILGLATGIACAFLIIIYVHSELGYDKFNSKAKDIYRIAFNATIGGASYIKPVSNAPTAQALLQEFPEVKNAVRFQKMEETALKYGAKQFYENKIFYAEPSVFDVFSLRVLDGDIKTMLQQPFSVVLTEAMAEKYFGNEDPIGKRLLVNSEDEYVVTGIMENVPADSHIKFDMLFSFETLYTKNPQKMEVWLGFFYYTYIILDEHTDYKVFESKLAGFIDRHMGEEIKALGGEINYFLQPLTDIHLYSNLSGELEVNGDINYLYVFGAIAFMVLAIACINFMNLSTARSMLRAKEIMMRKVIGAGRANLFRQFMGESLLFAIISSAIGLIFVLLAFPYMNSLTSCSIEYSVLIKPFFIFSFITLILLIAFFAGSYPALFLSGFSPLGVLLKSRRIDRTNYIVRSGLVVFQYAISISLIIGSVVIYSQLNYMKNKNLGFDKEQIVIIPLNGTDITGKLEAIKEELTSNPDILKVAASSDVPGHELSKGGYVPEGFERDQVHVIAQLNVDPDYFDLYNMKLTEGRGFLQEMQTDEYKTVLVNETAAKKFGWKKTEGKKILDVYDNGDEKIILGVIKDFHMISPHTLIEPVVIYNVPGYYHYLSVKISGNNVAGTIDYLDDYWQNFEPNKPFSYQFLDEIYDKQFRSDLKLTELVSIFSLLAVFIASLGLFGMATFTAERKIKEFGVRKILGASISELVLKISLQLTKWVLMANILAWPLSYYVLNIWMNNFAYSGGIGLSAFLISGIASLIIALLTVSYQAIRAAHTNPVASLKYE